MKKRSFLQYIFLTLIPNYKTKKPLKKMGLTVTQKLLDRCPNWATQQGWQVGDVINFGDCNCSCDAVGNKILNNDNWANFYNEHPPHRPS